MLEREQILDALRGCAAANGGRALGRAAFERETGITTSMIDRHWVRWSDAVTEAGLAANTMHAARPDDETLQALALLVRELGHYPVNNELRMKSRRSPGFPSHNAIARLGGKAVLTRRLAAYCDAHSDLADVRELLGDLADDAPADPAPPSTKGFVYLARSGKHYKIGQTGDLVRRTNELRIQLPERVELVHQIATDDPVGIERYWHLRFADRRTNGEWFALRHADVAAFKRRRFM